MESYRKGTRLRGVVNCLVFIVLMGVMLTGVSILISQIIHTLIANTRLM